MKAKGIKMKFVFLNEKGQAITEFAIVIPIFITMLLGIIEFGWIGYQRVLFTQGYIHASWDITAEKLNDIDPLIDVHSINNYSAAEVEPLIKDALNTSSLWGFKPANLVIKNAKATLYNKEAQFDVPGRVMGTVTSAKSITRYMDISAEIEYNIQSITGITNLFSKDLLKAKKDLMYTRVVGTQKRTE